MDINNIWEEFMINNSLTEESFAGNNITNQSGGNIDVNIEEHQVAECILFNCKQINYKVTFSNCLKTFEQAQDEINNMFINLHNKFISKLKNNNDLIRISFHHDSFDRRVSLPFMDKYDLSKKNLLSEFNHVIQSYRTINVNNNNSLTADVVIAFNVSGNRKRKINRKPRNPSQKKIKVDEYTQQDRFLNSSGIIPILNDDNFCSIRAIIVAIAFYDSDKNKKDTNLKKNYNSLIKCNSKLLSEKVNEIKTMYNLKDEPSGIPVFQILEKHLEKH